MVSQQLILTIIDRFYPAGSSGESIANRLRVQFTEIATALETLRVAGQVIYEGGLYYSRTLAVKRALTTPKGLSTVARELRYPANEVQNRLNRLLLLVEIRKIVPDRLNPAVPAGQEDLYVSITP
jgi:hypothetical protein